MGKIIDNIIIDNIKEGYCWKSDETAPKILSYGSKLELDPGKNPFYIEAQLVDNMGISYSVRYADGRYFVSETNLDQESTEYDEIVYVGHRMKGQELVFRRYWKAEKDELCEGMETLRFEKLVFVGFKK